VLVRVRNGIVESKTYVTTSQPANPTDYYALWPDVPELFIDIEDAIRVGQLGSAEYHPVTGHPRKIVFDHDGPAVNGADGEVTVFVKLVAPPS
jgi:hypothetical protein